MARKTMRFEDRMKHTPAEWQAPLCDVADTMTAMLAWFEDYGIEPTAADLVAAAALVLQQKGERK